MTTIVVDMKNLTVYSDSRCTVENEEHIDNVVKLFNIGGKIYFGSGCRKSVTTAIIALASGQEPVYHDSNFTVGCLMFDKGFPVCKVSYFNKKWYNKYIGLRVKPDNHIYYPFNSKNGYLVFGSGFEYARSALDLCDAEPADAIRYAASRDNGTNNIVQKLVLAREKC